MSEVWKPKDTSVYQDWIDSIFDEAENELSDWERNFLDSIQQQLNRSGRLSQKQEAVLEKIYSALTH